MTHGIVEPAPARCYDWKMRSFVAATLLALAACGGQVSSGPAWPKSAGRVEVEPEKDGGESLEPQQAVNIAAVERSEDRTPVVETIVVEAPAPKPAATPGDKTDGAKSAPPPTGDVQIEVIETKPEDIIIER